MAAREGFGGTGHWPLGRTSGEPDHAAMSWIETNGYWRWEAEYIRDDWNAWTGRGGLIPLMVTDGEARAEIAFADAAQADVALGVCASEHWRASTVERDGGFILMLPAGRARTLRAILEQLPVPIELAARQVIKRTPGPPLDVSNWPSWMMPDVGFLWSPDQMVGSALLDRTATVGRHASLRDKLARAFGRRRER